MPDQKRDLVLTCAGWLNRHQEDLIDNQLAGDVLGQDLDRDLTLYAGVSGPVDLRYLTGPR